MRLVFSAALILLLKVVSICCIGHLYVGILGYNNNNINSTCCSDKSCKDTFGCELIFEIVVDGLNRSVGPVSGRPSNTPLTPSQATAFVGESVTNPLSFAFNKWPGGAEVTVNVLDGDILIDQFNDSIILHTHSTYYVYNSLVDETNSSSLVLVFRYACGDTTGPSCFTDCADHMMNETCPLTTPKPPDVITFTGFTEHRCQTTDANGTTRSLNCTTGTSASSPTTIENETTESPTTTTLPTPLPTSTTTAATTTTTLPTTTKSTTTETITTSKTVSFSTTSTATDTHFANSTSIQTTKPHVRNNLSEPTKNDSAGVKDSTVTSSTTPSEGVSSVAVDPAAYWPGIVGGVLGGVAVFAAAGFICYWNRQKKLQKRQEIYNVNPKILRNFEEFEENGTSGRADVPMETEQY